MPVKHLSLTQFRQLRRNPLHFFTTLAQEQGDIASFRIGRKPYYLLNHPDHIRDLLITHHKHLQKGRALQQSKRLLGEGLLTSEGKLHLRQRRLMQPAFHRQEIARYADCMVADARQLSADWQPNTTIHVVAEMRQLLLPIVAKTLFGAEISADVATVGAALDALTPLLQTAMLPFGNRLLDLPTPRMKNARAALAALDALVYRLIDAENGESFLLSMLLAAHDEAGGMSRQQVRDEVLTLLLAGHETSVNGLTWCWYLLAQYPDVLQKLHTELSTVLAGRMPTIKDIPNLPYLDALLHEVLRLYPPAWAIGRETLQPLTFGNTIVPTGATVFASQWVTQRSSRYFVDPLTFNPDRWLTDTKPTKFTYFPFGAGARFCIGERFAWLEMQLVLAVLAQRWRLCLVEGQRVEPLARVTLRPKIDIQMRLTAL